MNTWVILRDVDGATLLQNLETRERKEVAATAIKGFCGLRRGLVTYDATTGKFVETGDFLPMSDELCYDLEEAYRQHDGQEWFFDWPHWQVEADESLRETVRARLEQQMAHHPYEFQILGLQRRFVLYYSDGTWQSQKRFECMAPKPKTYPYRRDGKLWPRYCGNWSSLMRDAGIAYPKKLEQEVGGLKPQLYAGPAWVVRFLLDGQQILPNCLMFVDDEGTFLFSSWCQRHDQTSYHDGINLQLGIYSFDGWIVSSAVQKALKEQRFKPKAAQVKIFKPAELKAMKAPTLRSFDELLAAEVAKRPVPTVPVPSALELAFRQAAGDGDLAATATSFLDALVAEGITAARRLPLPIQSPLVTVHEYNRPALAAFTREDTMYFTTAPWEADARDHPAEDTTRLCVRDAKHTHHFHLRVDDCTLDVDALRALVHGYVEAVAEERRASQPLPPISEDLLAVVRAQMETLLATPRAPKPAPAPAPAPEPVIVDGDGYTYVKEGDLLAVTDPAGDTLRWEYNTIADELVSAGGIIDGSWEDKQRWQWFHYGRPLGLTLRQQQVARAEWIEAGVLRETFFDFDTDSRSYDEADSVYVREHADVSERATYPYQCVTSGDFDEDEDEIEVYDRASDFALCAYYDRLFQEQSACV